MPFYVFAWMAAISYGLYAVVAKLIGKYQLKNISQFSFFSLLFGGIIILTISLFNGAGFPTNWTFIILTSLSVTFGNLLYVAAIKNLDVSVMSPLFNIRTVITVFLGYLFLGEVLDVKTLLLIGVIVFAGFFATMDEKFSLKSFFKKNVAVGLSFMLVLSLQSLFVNKAIAQNDYWTVSMWIGLLAMLFSFALLYPRFKDDLRKTKLADYSGVLVLSVLGSVGDLVANKAYGENIGISSVIVSLPVSMIFVFLLSIWKPSLLEKHSLKVYFVRFLAATIMIWGALKLSN